MQGQNQGEISAPIRFFYEQFLDPFLIIVVGGMLILMIYGMGNKRFGLKLADRIAFFPMKIGQYCGYLILPLIAVIMFDVVTRKIDYFRVGLSELPIYTYIQPIILQDSEWHLHGMLLLLSFGFGYLMNAHVRVDIFREKLSRNGQTKMELFGLLALGIPYLLILLWFAHGFVQLSFSQGEGSESLTGIPMRYLIKTFTIVGFLLLLMAMVATTLRLWAVMFGDDAERVDAINSVNVYADQELPTEVIDEFGVLQEHNPHGVQS